MILSRTIRLLALVAAISLAACGESKFELATAPKGHNLTLNVEQQPFGTMPDGRPVTQYTLTNDNGMRIRLINYGAITTSVEVPDRNGKIADITLGFDTMDGWLGSKAYFGSTVGRYANRIDKGRFTLDGEQYQLTTNDGLNHLHGGAKGFDKVLWDAEPVNQPGKVGVKFTYHAKDMEEGYPGNATVVATYTLNNKNEYTAHFTATTDEPTIINIAHHSYWNLGGADSGDILDQKLMFNGDAYTPVNDQLIPTGEIVKIAGTPMDFRSLTPIGKNIDQTDAGYDHNFVLHNQSGKMALSAQVIDPDTGRVMEIWSDQPGIQFYSGNFLDGTIAGKGGVAYQKYAGFCLETQHYPDSPNQPEWPSVVLRPGETYEHTMIHKFLVAPKCDCPCGSACACDGACGADCKCEGKCDANCTDKCGDACKDKCDTKCTSACAKQCSTSCSASCTGTAKTAAASSCCTGAAKSCSAACSADCKK